MVRFMDLSLVVVTDQVLDEKNYFQVETCVVARLKALKEWSKHKKDTKGLTLIVLMIFALTWSKSSRGTDLQWSSLP